MGDSTLTRMARFAPILREPERGLEPVASRLQGAPRGLVSYGSPESSDVELATASRASVVDPGDGS